MKDLELKNNAIFEMVLEESRRQIEKWGIQDRSPFEWLAYTTEELGELSESISECVYRGDRRSEVVKEAIQTATLCLKIAEMFLDGRDRFKKRIIGRFVDPSKGGYLVQFDEELPEDAQVIAEWEE